MTPPNKYLTRAWRLLSMAWILTMAIAFLMPAATNAAVIADYDAACCALPPFAPCCTSGAGGGADCIDESCGPNVEDQTGVCRRSSGSDGPIMCVPTAEAARGAGSTEERVSLPVTPRLAIDIPTIRLSDATAATGRFVDIPWLADYIAGMFRFAIPAAAVMAVVMMMIGGVQWTISAGDSGRIGQAKKRITDAAIGLAILVGSYALLATINPNLVLLPTLRIQSVERETIEYVGYDEATVSPGGGDFSWTGSGVPAVSGSATRENLQSVCQRGTPATVEAFRNILTTWVALGRQGAAVYVRGGRTGRNGCSNNGSAAWIRNHLTLHHVAFPEGATVETLRSIYQAEMVDKIFAAGRMCGDCVSWTGQLFACAGYNVAIAVMKVSENGQYYLAQGSTCAEAARNIPGGLRFGDVFYSDNVGHMFTYTGGAGLPYEIVEMGGLRGSLTSIPGIDGTIAAINGHPSKDAYFSWIDRNRGDRNETLGTSRRQACRAYRILR
ncbi:MAG: hypothetical protein ABIJ46_05285 [bacterium]